MIYWLRAFILAIIAGETNLYMLKRYAPSIGSIHFAISVAAFVVVYTMIPRVNEIRKEISAAFSIHLVDQKTLVIDPDEIHRDKLTAGEMICLRNRSNGAIHTINVDTSLFIVNRPAKGSFIKVTPYKSMELII